LTELIEAAVCGDVVVMCRLDRLGRSLAELLELVEDLAGRGVGLRSVVEQIDTWSAAGWLVLHVFGTARGDRTLADAGRTMTGLAASRSGRVGGRPPALNAAQIAHAQALAAAGTPIGEIAELLGRAAPRCTEFCAASSAYR
jgi:DNA invertase Pin-like site-specific DNA recombinase